MGVFSKVFKAKDGATRSQSSKAVGPPPISTKKQIWEDAWTRKEVGADEVEELLRVCTQEMKSRGSLRSMHHFHRNLTCFTQRSTHPSSSFPSDQPPTPARPGTSSETSSKTGQVLNTPAPDFAMSSKSQNQW